MQLILWGLIKKMLIADACAPIVESVFSNVSNASWLDLWWAAFLFAIQIYGDFSAYSEMAMGLVVGYPTDAKLSLSIFCCQYQVFLEKMAHLPHHMV
jgi:D-alanyl-lipoteichoic acid acyltransferase DltB (MBOAT superfamily)